MSPTAIRTPLVVTDRELFGRARERTLDVARATAKAVHDDLPRRVAEHADKHKAG
jgi:post-segregation antitoxin (ccd killing protein)